MKLNLVGVSWTDRALVVTFTVGEVRARRVHELRIPLELLCDPEFWMKLNRAEARRLKRAWGDPEPTLPAWREE